jgi:hypothetical protein
LKIRATKNAGDVRAGRIFEWFAYRAIRSRATRLGSIVAKRAFVDRDGSHLREVNGDRHFLFNDHQLIGFDHMLEPAVDLFVFVGRGGKV